MSDAPRPTPDGSVAQAVELRRHLQDQRVGKLAQTLGVEALAWLALPPTWTEPVASSAGFPSRQQPLEQFLSVALESGIVERDPPLRADPETGRGFWISDSDREPVLEYLRAHTAFGYSGLEKVAVDISRRLLRNQEGVPLPDALRHWADLASEADQPYALAQRLGRDVAELTRDNRTGEALARVDAGESLARAMGGPLGAAVRLGNRRIELEYRRASDQRHLRRYFHRVDQERAFEDLLDPATPAWALHYLGMGGAGKTMLLRYITSRPDGRELVISRIDFDHLSPDYPVKRPGQLLLELAVELRSFSRSTQEEQLFDKIRHTAEELHEALGDEPPASNPLANVRRPEFERILMGFCDLLRVLPPPVILILDTCEELARVPVVNKILPSVEATFEILQRVHDLVSSVRVIFAGRRPIASAGHDWMLRESVQKVSESGDIVPERGLRQFLKPRTFLRLHEIRGLAEDDARTFLTERLELKLDEKLTRVILDRSVDIGRAADVVVTAGAKPDEDSRTRHNLFDLALYGEWLRDDPKLGADQIVSGGSDPYVDLRIVQRVREPLLKDALPAIAALGRFDAAMLRSVFPAWLRDKDYDALYSALADYEWLELQRDQDLDASFLEVDRNLLPRIRAYFAEPARQWETARAIEPLGPALAALVRSRALGELSVNHIEAALVVLPGAEAARLWAEVLLRVPSEADDTWLRTITERLIGEDGEMARRPGLEGGFDAASDIVALQSDSIVGLRGHTESLAGWPDAVSGAWLRRCQQALELADGTAYGYGDDRRRIEELTDLLRSFEARLPAPGISRSHAAPSLETLERRMSEEETAALLAAVGVLADRAQSVFLFEGAQALLMGRAAEAAVAWADVLAAADYPAPLVAQAEALAAKLSAVCDDIEAARELGERALETAGTMAADERRLWLFWKSPTSPVDRIRLEMLTLHRGLGLVAIPDVVSWLPGALSRNKSVDGARLASAIERWRLDRELPAETDLGVSEAAERYRERRRPVAEVHRHNPPFFVTLAMKRAALGQFDRADAMLRDRCREAEANRNDAETVRLATLSRVDLACSARHVPADLAPAVAGLSLAARQMSSAGRVLTLRALTGVDVTRDFRPMAHDQWRTTVVNDAKDATRVLEAQAARFLQLSRGDSPQLTAARVRIEDELDLVEMVRLAERNRIAPEAIPGISGSWKREAGIWRGSAVPQYPVRVDDLNELVSAMLRLYALDPIPEDQLAASVDLPRALHAFLPFPPPFAPAPGMAPAVLLPAARAHMVEIVKTIAMELETSRHGLADVAGPPVGGLSECASRLLEHVGWRRWAALAQEEGELLALRLPDAATRLLDLSTRLSARGGDHVAVIKAAASWRLAAYRAGLVAQTLAAPLQEAWTKASAVNESVPPWTAVEAELRFLRAVQTPGEAIADHPHPIGAWDGWFCRVVLSLAILDRAYAPFADGIPRRFPNQAMSPELDVPRRRMDLPALSESETPDAVAEAEAKDGRQRTQPPLGVAIAFFFGFGALWLYLVYINAFGSTGDPTPAAARFLWPVLGVSALASLAAIVWVGRSLALFFPAFPLFFAFLAALYWLVGWGADQIFPVRPGRLTRTIALFGLLFIIGAAPKRLQVLRRWWQSRVARKSEATIWVSESSSGGDLREQVAAIQSVTLRMSCRRASVGSPMPVPVLRDLPPWSATIRTAGLRPYADAAAEIDPDALKPIAEIRAELHREVWPVAMRVESSWHFVPWEGLLSLAARPATPAQTSRSPREPVFFYRYGTSPAAEPSVPSSWSDGRVCLVGAWASGADKIWRVTGRKVVRDEALNKPTPGDVRPPTVIHAIGTPVLTSAGPRLQLAEPSRRGPMEAAEGSGSVTPGPPDVPAAARFLDRRMLPPKLPLLILQQQPADSLARLGSDREQASLLRAVAGDLFEAGCQAIVVIPSVPAELAEKVTKRIVQRISESGTHALFRKLATTWTSDDESRRALRELATAVRDARDEIFAWPGFENTAQSNVSGKPVSMHESAGRDADAQREVAWDSCVFARLPFGTGTPPESAGVRPSQLER